MPIRAREMELVFWPNGFPIEKLLFSKKSQAELMFLAGIAMSVVGGLVGSRVGSRVGSQSSGLGRQLDAKRYDDDMTTDALTTNDIHFFGGHRLRRMTPMGLTTWRYDDMTTRWRYGDDVTTM